MIDLEKKVLKSKTWQPGDVLLKILKENNSCKAKISTEMWILLERQTTKSSTICSKFLYVRNYNNSTISDIYYNCLGNKEYFLNSDNYFDYIILEA